MWRGFRSVWVAVVSLSCFVFDARANPMMEMVSGLPMPPAAGEIVSNSAVGAKGSEPTQRPTSSPGLPKRGAGRAIRWLRLRVARIAWWNGISVTSGSIRYSPSARSIRAVAFSRSTSHVMSFATIGS